LHVARVALIKDRTACRNRLDTARNRIVITQLKELYGILGDAA